MDCQILLSNIDKIHTTEMGIIRIKKNLSLDNIDVVEFIKKIIIDNNSIIKKIGKNWYVDNNNYRITVNSYSYTIITAHIIN